MSVKKSILTAAGILISIYSISTFAWEDSKVPSPRSGFSMAWDSARHVLVLHGGIVPGGRLQDTWEWNEKGWRLACESGPAALSDHALEYDPARNTVLLFGGRDSEGKLNGTTWGWDSNSCSWNKLSDSGPPPRNLFEMAYDPGREVIVLFGGSGEGRKSINDTWEWNGKNWNQVATDGPSPRGSYALAYDPVMEAMILTGGWGTTSSLGETWSWDGKAWKKHDLVTPARTHHAMAFDTKRNRMVLMGGFSSGGRSSQLYELMDNRWQLINAEGPGARAEHEILYAPDHGILLFGGITGQKMSFKERQRMNDLWLWNGQSWRELK